jgi:biuret amidohydrolase
MQRRGIRNLVFAGVTSDCCVHTTMTNANDKGYECLLLADCSAALDRRNHAMIKAITVKRGGQFGAVAQSSALLAALGVSTWASG